MSKEKKVSQVLAGIRAGVSRKFYKEQRAIHGANWEPADKNFKAWEHFELDKETGKLKPIGTEIKKDVNLSPLKERSPNIREVGAKYKGKQVVRTREEIIDSARKNNGVSIEVIDLQLSALKDTEAFIFYTDGPTKITYSQKYGKLLISPHCVQLKEKK